MVGMTSSADVPSVSAADPPMPPSLPPPPYSPQRALDDLPAIKYAAAEFLDSRMAESEDFCLEYDPKRERLYVTSGYSLIQCLKALMSYEDKDLHDAMRHINHGHALAAAHRAPPAPLNARLAGLVWAAPAAGVAHIKAMTRVQRHAELLYAETLFAKALLGVVCSGSWLAFIKEALSFRAMINIYMQLGAYVDAADAEATARGAAYAEDIDKDFRSGVELGVGAAHLILSFLPESLLAVAEIFGYRGDRDAGLALLMRAGGWRAGADEPAVGAAEEGLRRSLADIALLVFHLVISSFTFKGVDIAMAQTILDWNLQRYPNGVFFLFGQGRLLLRRSQPARALESYARAAAAQRAYRTLHYISFWESAVCHFALWDIPGALACWRVLAAEATWSPACYLYGAAACQLQLGGSERAEEAAALLARVPGVLNRIAGRSIPIEKFVARKARKFVLQGGRLALPALEFAYLFLAVAHAPRCVVAAKMLPAIEDTIAQLAPHARTPAGYAGGHGYWDDYCLARFLEGVCCRYIAYPDADAVVDVHETVGITQQTASSRALRAFGAVVRNGGRIALDHYILYHAHYELGRLHACMGVKVKAREHLQLVLSGKPLEADTSARKGKYSMQSALVMRAAAALEGLGFG